MRYTNLLLPLPLQLMASSLLRESAQIHHISNNINLVLDQYGLSVNNYYSHFNIGDNGE